jgi:hypothetical protein
MPQHQGLMESLARFALRWRHCIVIALSTPNRHTSQPKTQARYSRILGLPEFFEAERGERVYTRAPRSGLVVS